MSHEVQEEFLRGLASRQGWNVVEPVHHSEVSGSKEDAERLETFIEEALADEWDVLAMANVDRSFRSTRVALNFLERMISRGKEVWIGDRCVNDLTSDGWTHLEIELVFAESKARKNADAANSKADKIRLHGTWYKKGIPRGYGRDPDFKSSRLKTRLLVDEPEANRIRALFRRFARESWMTAIHGPEVKALGFTPKDLERVLAILRDRIYLGMVPFSEDEVYHERYQIVDDETWIAASRNGPRTPSPGTKNKSVLAVDRLGRALGQSLLVQELVKHHNLTCPTCRTLLHWDGVETFGGYEIPRVRCSNNHRFPLLTRAQVQDLKVAVACFQCRSSGRNAFEVALDRSSGTYEARCRHCGWTARGLSHKPWDGRSAGRIRRHNEGTRPHRDQTKLTTQPKPRRPPGRRRPKRPGKR